MGLKIAQVLVLVMLSFSAPFGGLSAAEIEVLPSFASDHKMIIMRGPIEEGDDDRFYEIAERVPRASVVLESPGGSVTTGISIGAEIAIRGYTTLVLDGPGCHSICAIMWVSGVRRYMSPDANISVHAAYRMQNNSNGDVDFTESGPANAQIGAFLNELGLSADAIRYFTFAGPTKESLPVTPQVAQSLSFDVHIQTPNRVITPAERPTPRRITRQVSQYTGMVESCATLFQVSAAFWEQQARSVLEQGHALFGGETFAPLLSEYVDRTKAEIDAQGWVRWCISAEKNLRSDNLQTGITGPSFDCAKAATPTEFAICDSRDLWALDRAMASLYFFYRENTNTSVSREFLDSQRSWLRRRNSCADNTACLLERYSSRLFDFGA